MARESGFNSTAIVGYAQPNKWGPEEQWDRFNSHITKKAFMENNSKLLQEIEVRKKAYLEKAYFILAEYTDEYGADHLGITTCEGKKEISYTYPIIVSRK
jgi:hypothetical protein